MNYGIMHKTIFFSSKVIQTEIYLRNTIIKGTPPEKDLSLINNLIFVLLRQLAILRVFISVICYQEQSAEKRGRLFKWLFKLYSEKQGKESAVNCCF